MAESLLDLFDALTEEERLYVIAHLTDEERLALWRETERAGDAKAPDSAIGQALEIDAGYRVQPHLQYLSDQLDEAIVKVEAGESQFVAVSMPPRMGKSTILSTYAPVWLLRRHPDWRCGLISHSPHLASTWGRQVRRIVTERRGKIGLEIAPDAGAITDWETTAGGGVTSRSVGGSITGLGFRVLIIDDAVKDYADAHSAKRRDALWEWWQSAAFTRLEEPFLVIVVGTRWHEDDFIGRLLKPPADTEPLPWRVIRFPAIAEQVAVTDGKPPEPDALGREPGDPLLSPLKAETRDQAIARWKGIERAVGSYTWAALYQQRPVPAEGTVFLPSWWRFWTTNPDLIDDTTVLFDPLVDGASGTWLDSWDCAFKGTDTADYVVGQRWCRVEGDRFLVGQSRDRMTFTETLAVMLEWEKSDSLGGTGKFVGKRLVEEAANGYAIIDTLQRKVSGMKAIRADKSKEARARAVSPEVESGNVFLPHPSEPGHEWVHGLLGELLTFPSGPNDDQVDALSQGLGELRDTTVESVASIVIGQANYWGAV